MRRDWLRVLIVFIVVAVLSWIAQAVGGLFIPNRWVFLHALAGDIVSILVAPFGIIGLVLLFNDIRRAFFGVSDAEIRAGEDGLLAGPTP